MRFPLTDKQLLGMQANEQTLLGRATARLEMADESTTLEHRAAQSAHSSALSLLAIYSILNRINDSINRREQE